ARKNSRRKTATWAAYPRRHWSLLPSSCSLCFLPLCSLCLCGSFAMTLSDLSIKNPVFAVMLSAAMVVFGYLGYRDMGVSQFPEIDFPVVSIVITREAASPDIMDGDVTDVVEDAVAGVEGVDYIMSQSLEGTSIVTVYFHLSRNIDVAMQDVQNAVSAARGRLPIDIDPPVIAKVNPNNLPVMWLTLSGPVPLSKISDFAE